MNKIKYLNKDILSYKNYKIRNIRNQLLINNMYILNNKYNNIIMIK